MSQPIVKRLVFVTLLGIVALIPALRSQTPAPANPSSPVMTMTVDRTTITEGQSYVLTIAVGPNLQNVQLDGLPLDGFGIMPTGQRLYRGTVTRTPPAAGTITHTLRAYDGAKNAQRPDVTVNVVVTPRASAPAAAASTMAAAPAAAPAPPPVAARDLTPAAAPQSTGPRRLLSAGDLTYAGMISLPEDTAGARFGWSRAAITGRMVNGRTHLFVTGSIGGNGDHNNIKDAVYEVELHGLERATFVRNWKDITQGRQLVHDGANGTEIRGLLYKDGYLYWAYGDSYFSGDSPNPSIGASKLDDATGAVTAYGPWRTAEHSQKTRGYMTTIPADAAAGGGRTIGVGAPATAGNASGPRGAMLFALDAFDPATKQADTKSNSSSVSLKGKRVVYSDAKQPQPRNANYKICGYKVDNEPGSGGWIAPGDPTWNNRGPRGDLALDRLDGVAWIRTSAVEALVFVGQMTDVVPGATTYAGDTLPHIWYGPENNVCPHGQPARTEGTGPKSGSMVPVAIVFDPAKLATSSAPVPAATIRLTGPGLPTNATNDPVFGGAWFDGVDTLYVSIANEAFEGEPRPVIIAFKIKT